MGISYSWLILQNHNRGKLLAFFFFSWVRERLRSLRFKEFLGSLFSFLFPIPLSLSLSLEWGEVRSALKIPPTLLLPTVGWNVHCPLFELLLSNLRRIYHSLKTRRFSFRIWKSGRMTLQLLLRFFTPRCNVIPFLFLILYFIIKSQIWLNLYNLRNASGTIQIQISIL